MESIYITLAQWTQIKSKRVGTDPYYVQSYEALPSKNESRRKLVCITFMEPQGKSMFMLKYGEYL